MRYPFSARFTICSHGRLPTKQIGWMSEHGEQLDLPLEGEDSASCSHTGAMYRLDGDRVTKTGE